jgi:hypothetical protein
MTKEEFLIDTINHYTLENRCVDYNGKCKYSPVYANKDNSEGCAIGRHLDPELAYQIDKDLEDKGASIVKVSHIYSLPDWMENLGIFFLNQIQMLHDENEYWDSKGLSEKGWKQVRCICIDYSIDFELIKTNYKIKTNNK